MDFSFKILKLNIKFECYLAYERREISSTFIYARKLGKCWRGEFVRNRMSQIKVLSRNLASVWIPKDETGFYRLMANTDTITTENKHRRWSSADSPILRPSNRPSVGPTAIYVNLNIFLTKITGKKVSYNR